jgi:glutaredoxin
MAFEYLKPLLAFVVAIYLVTTALNGTSSFVHSRIQTALAPICNIPGSSYVLPFCKSSPRRGSSEGPDFDTLVGLQSSFEDIVKENEQSSTLPQTMKRGELAIRDIKTLVRYSKLPSKSELELEFDTFIAMAKEASSELIKYNSRIGGTVDKVINTNKWTIRILEGLRAHEASKGLISQVAASLNPLSAFQAPPLTLQQKVFDQYLQHISTNKDDLEAVIQMGESLVFLLSSLEDKLETIYSIAVRDDLHISQNRDELLSQLWTKLGGNASTRKDYDRQLILLKSVASYRKEAVLHVSATLLKLQEIAAGMEDLRDNVAAPEVLGFRDEMPVERYLELVKGSVDRLADARGEQQRIEKDGYMRAMKDPNAIDGIKEVDSGPIVKAKNKVGMRR